MRVSRRAIVALSTWLLGGMAVAVAVLVSAGETWPVWIVPTALAVLASAIVGPALVMGWMLGRVFARHGGWVGMLFAAGAVAGPAGQLNDLPLLAWPGYGALVVGLAGLVLLAVRSFRRLAGPPRTRGTARSRTRRVSRDRGARTG